MEELHSSVPVPGWRTSFGDSFDDYDLSSSPSSLSSTTHKEKTTIPLFHRCPPRAGCFCENLAADRACWAPVSRVTPSDTQNIIPLEGAAKNAAAECVPLWKELASGVVVICLADREDRFIAACNRLHAAGLCTEAIFYRPRRPDALQIVDEGITRPGRLGCYEAHREVAIAGLRAQLPSLLVLEDDFMLLPSPLDISASVRKAASSLRSLPPDSCDMFLLGGLPLVGVPCWSRLMEGHMDAFRSIAVCMHAYVARPAFMAKIAATSYLDNRRRKGKEEAVDWFATSCKQVCFSPQFIGQACTTQSDISSDEVLAQESLEWDDRIGPVVVRFARDNPLAYDVIVFAIIPLLLLILSIVLLRRLKRFVFGSTEVLQLKEGTAGRPFILASTIM